MQSWVRLERLFWNLGVCEGLKMSLRIRGLLYFPFIHLFVHATHFIPFLAPLSTYLAISADPAHCGRLTRNGRRAPAAV